jgi:4-amino-4-deoxy-L-arabinose transferase-like glycosyltransferase
MLFPCNPAWDNYVSFVISHMTEATRSAAAPKTTPASAAPVPGAAAWFAFCLCAIFVLQGLVFIPYVGIQNDEALFGAAILDPVGIEYRARIFGHMVPTMVMSYIGALKAWVYAAIFAVWPPSPYSLRVPVIVIGAVTIWLFFLLLRDTAGKRAAAAGAALLAFDTTFLLTNTFDWGPVAFQHLLLVAGVYLLVRFHKSGKAAWLGAGFFCLGLGLWDKALFAWMLGGLGVAALAVFPREVFSRLNWRNTGLAVACFLIGCWPLVGYNKAEHLKTFRTNARYSAAGLDTKLSLVRVCLEGSSLLGYIVREEPAPAPVRPASTLEEWSIAVNNMTDEPQSALTGVAFVLALALLPWLWTTTARKPMLFALIFMLATWVQMAFTQGAGGGTHHTVLLWPFPHLFIAVAFARASGALNRAAVPVLAAAIAIVCGSNLLVTNRHLAQLVQRGSEVVWTDAIYPLAEYMSTLRTQRVYVMDWGIFDGLRILDHGRLPLMVGSDQISKESMDDNDRRIWSEILSARNAVFVGHTEGNEVFGGVSAKVRSAAEASGYRKQVLKVIGDRHGRPLFEVYRFSQATTSSVSGGIILRPRSHFSNCDLTASLSTVAPASSTPSAAGSVSSKAL